MKSVPLVPRERLHFPAPTVPVPIAAAALSHAPDAHMNYAGNPGGSETAGFIVPGCS